MDPLSVSASVTAVLQLAATVIKYLNSVRGADSERRRLLSEIFSINSILITLQDQEEKEAQDDTIHQMFKTLRSSNGPLEQLTNILECLKSKLVPIKGSCSVVGPIIWPFKRSEIKDLLEAIERQKTLFTLARQNDLIALSNAVNSKVNDVHNELVHFRDDLLQLEKDDKYRKFLAWLNAPDPWINQKKASKLRHDHTGNWFIDGNVYKDWLLAAPSPLWLHGIPGCGKTILASTVVQQLFKYRPIEPRAAVVFYYFDFNDAAKQTYENLIRSLVKQLVSQPNLVSGRTHALYQPWQTQYNDQSEDQLMSMLHQLLRNFEKVYLVVDALDECVERENLLRILQHWTSWNDIQLHTIFASRKEKDIEEVLCCLCDDRRIVSIQSTLVDKDIGDYVQARLHDDMKLKRWRNKPRVQQLIVHSLMERANGMFRWAACQLDVLGDCLTEAQLRKALDGLPQTLDETYARILSNIKKEYQEYAFLMLQWLCFSPRPLRLEELAEVVGITGSDPSFHPDERLADPQDVLNICSTLITTESSTAESYKLSPGHFDCQCRDRINDFGPLFNCDCYWPSSSAGRFRSHEEMDYSETLQTYARLAHFSVKEYLISSRIPTDTGFSFKICESAAQSMMYASCLAYLLHVNKVDRSRRELCMEYPFIFHATHHWQTHARSVERRQDLVPPLAIKFLLNEDDSFASWLALSNEYGAPLYHASSHGLARSVQMLLDQGGDVNSRSRRYAAISAAAEFGHEQVVEVLLRNGANVNINFSRPADAAYGFRTPPLDAVDRYRPRCSYNAITRYGPSCSCFPLLEAVNTGRRRIVWQLLEAGADVSGFILIVALEHRDEHILQMLLDHGLNVDAWQCGLIRAVTDDNEPATRRFLNHRFTAIQLRDQSICVALTHAIRKANAPMVNLLLDQTEFREDIIDHIGRTPLSYAAEIGATVMLSILMSNSKRYIDAADNTGRSLLSYAAGSGYTAAFHILLKRSDRHIDLADDLGRTPLSYAAGKGCSGHKTVALLLGHEKVNADSQDHEGRTPLSYAAGKGRYGDKKVALLLGHEKVNVNSQDHKGRTPLSYAAGEGPYGDKTVALLLGDEKVNADSQDHEGRTPLSHAVGASRYRGTSPSRRKQSKKEHQSLVKMLLDHNNTNVQTPDHNGWTPLSWAVQADHPNLAELLLPYGQQGVDQKDRNGETPIGISFREGSDEILKLLSEHGVIDLKELSNDVHAWNRISDAISRGHRELLDLLLKFSHLDLCSQDERGRTFISLAAETGNEKTLELLLRIDSSTVDLPDETGRTPLSYVFSANERRSENSTDSKAKLLLVDYAVRPDLPDKHCRAPISYAAETASTPLLQLLLDRHVNVDRPDDRGRTPLSYALGGSGYESGYARVVRLIFEKSTSGKDYADHDGRTPLSYAVERGWTGATLPNGAETGRRGAIRFMLKSGLVEVNTPDKRGLTPLAYAEMTENERDPRKMAEDERFPRRVEISEVLRSYGAYRLDIDKPTREGTDLCTDSAGSTDPRTTEPSALHTLQVKSLPE